jgi:hypothetical protein
MNDEDIANDIQDIKTSTDDIFAAVENMDSNHVDVIDRLDKAVELLERIAVALEKPTLDAELRAISPQLADMLKEGRVR